MNAPAAGMVYGFRQNAAGNAFHESVTVLNNIKLEGKKDVDPKVDKFTENTADIDAIAGALVKRLKYLGYA